jgi:hypothetical protein
MSRVTPLAEPEEVRSPEDRFSGSSPGLESTKPQAMRLFWGGTVGIRRDVQGARDGDFLSRADDGVFVLSTNGFEEPTGPLRFRRVVA